MILEISGITICTIFVCISASDILKGSPSICNIPVNVLGLIVFMLSITMALVNSGSVRKKKNIIISYLNALENGSPDEIKNKYKIKAEQLISPLDVYEEKFKRGEQIRLHDKRDVLRNYIICIGIFLMAIIAINILFILNLNFPILLAWESFIVYFLVMLEFYIYQLIVNKNGSNVFSEKHRKCITIEKVNRIEDMKYLQSILYMRCDRFKNYMKTLRIFTITMNILSISITIIITGDNEKIRNWFGFENSSSIVSVFFSMITIILYFIDISFGDFIDKKINDLEAYISLTYSRKNYENLKMVFTNILEYNNLFDKRALDIARGTYEYNIEKINNKGVINYKHIFTVKQRVINNIPRVKITALFTFLFVGTIFVWYKMNIYNIIFVCLITLFVFFASYYGMLLYDYKKYKDWDKFCKNICSKIDKED